MKVILFGGTGMVGQGVLRECVLDPDVTEVLTVGRSPTNSPYPKVREIVQPDLFELRGYERNLAGYDACFFCLGVSATSMIEKDYTHITHDLTILVAKALVKSTPSMCFIYVSGAGTGGSAMWARVKGQTESAILELPFRTKCMFRPALIEPLHGVQSKTKLYRVIYSLLSHLFPLIRAIAPKRVTTSEQVGRAMLEVAKHGAPKPILENDDINQLNPPPKQLPAMGGSKS